MASPVRSTAALWLGIGTLGLLAAASVAVVPENQQVVVSRMGEPDRVINRFRPESANAKSGAGLVLHLPLIERLTWLPRGVVTVNSERQSIRTADQQNLVLDTAVTLRVIDPVRLAKKGGSADSIASEVNAWLPGLLKEQLAALNSSQVQLTGASGAAARTRGVLDAKLREAGLQVIDLRIARALLPAGAQQDTLLAMEDRREAVAAEERNRGAREVQQITSDAEAEAAKILEASAGRDPEFYDFYRAMRSYEAIFAAADRKDKATFVLPPEDGYLKHFNNR